MSVAPPGAAPRRGARSADAPREEEVRCALARAGFERTTASRWWERYAAGGEPWESAPPARCPLRVTPPNAPTRRSGPKSRGKTPRKNRPRNFRVGTHLFGERSEAHLTPASSASRSTRFRPPVDLRADLGPGEREQTRTLHLGTAVVVAVTTDADGAGSSICSAPLGASRNPVSLCKPHTPDRPCRFFFVRSARRSSHSSPIRSSSTTQSA